jgi:hypothetical protein
MAGAGGKAASIIPAKMTLKKGARDTTLDPSIPRGKSRTYRTPQCSIWSTEASGWFSCGYGPFRREFGASPEALRQMAAPSTRRFVTMFQEGASLAEADVWLRNLSHKALEGKPAEEDQLALMLNLLRDGLMPGGVTVDRVDSDGLWLKDSRGADLAWTEMGDGHRSTAALLTDLVRHLIGIHGLPGLAERSRDGKTVIKRSGIVLIDEMEAHLHPAWQQDIGFWLRRRFPAVQFLVATHSPLICQAADPGGLFVLDHPPRQLTEEEYRSAVASRPDTLLRTAAFGMANTGSPRAVPDQDGEA